MPLTETEDRWNSDPRFQRPQITTDMNGPLSGDRAARAKAPAADRVRGLLRLSATA
jgi:hypothetical protein